MWWTTSWKQIVLLHQAGLNTSFLEYKMMDKVHTTSNLKTKAVACKNHAGYINTQWGQNTADLMLK